MSFWFFVVLGGVVVMRGVDSRVLVQTASLFIFQRARLELLFLWLPQKIADSAGSPTLRINLLRAQLGDVLGRGIFLLMRDIESGLDKEFSQDRRETRFAYGFSESAKLLAAALSNRSATSVAKACLITLLDLSLLSRSIFLVLRPIRGPFRGFLWAKHNAVTSAFRSILSADILHYVPNHPHQKRPTDLHLRLLSQVIVRENMVIPEFADRISSNPYASDALRGFLGTGFLTLDGRLGFPHREFPIEEVMDALGSRFSRHRLSFVPAIVAQMVRANQIDRWARQILHSKEGRGAHSLSLVSDVVGVHAHLVCRAAGSLIYSL